MYEKLVRNIESIDINKIVAELLSTEEYQIFITGLNKERLSKKGEDINGNEIKTYFANSPNVYANRTISIKNGKSGTAGITEHVTLFDTGFFYNSFALKVKRTVFAITASKKRLTQLEENIDTSLILGLTEKDKEILSKKIMPDVIKKLHIEIFHGVL